MKPSTFKRALLATTCLVAGVAGCELITDIDRTKIPGGGFDGSVDSPGLDVTPQPVPDAQGDVARDVAPDSPGDATTTDAGDAAASDGDATTTDAAADADDAAADADDSG
jgi:hypothetical protein